MGEDHDSEKGSLSEAVGGPSSELSERPPPPPAETTPPKDDAKAWLRVLGAWMLFVAAWGPSLAYGAFQLYYTNTLLSDNPSSTIAWIGSINSFLLICAGVVVGPLFDRGYLRPILLAGSVLVVFGFMMLSLSTEYYQVMLAQGICIGLGAGLVYVPALAFVTSSFEKHRAYAVAVTTTGASAGGVFFPIAFLKLIPEVGFAWTVRIFGFITLALFVVGIALVWGAPTKTTKPRRVFEIGAFAEPVFGMVALTFFLQFIGYFIPIAWIPFFVSSSLRSGDDLGIYAVAIFNAASIFGRLVPSLAIKRFGAINVVFVATITTTVILFCWIAVSSFAGYVVWCCAIGFSSGVYISGNPVLISHPEVSSLAVLGSRMGMLWAVSALGVVIGTPIAGSLIDLATGDFLRAQVFAGCIMAGACLAFLYPVWKLNAYNRKMKSGQT